jgi:hypothetical protein
MCKVWTTDYLCPFNMTSLCHFCEDPRYLHTTVLAVLQAIFGPFGPKQTYLKNMIGSSERCYVDNKLLEFSTLS